MTEGFAGFARLGLAIKEIHLLLRWIIRNVAGPKADQAYRPIALFLEEQLHHGFAQRGIVTGRNGQAYLSGDGFKALPAELDADGSGIAAGGAQLAANILNQ